MGESVNEKRGSTHPLNNSSTHQPSSEIAIRVDHVSKKFCRSLRKSMRYGMHDIGRNLLRMSTKPDKLRKDEFWAVDDVPFELRRGETLGIIGPNGSGKSTILKMLNGLYMPDKGRIEINGRVGALIEVGAGFHPMLSGRENIYVNGAILGMTKEEMDEKFEDIIEFADIGDFLDMPVKNYSSGMYVRLGFAVAAQLEPEVLLIDEVLAVGDVGFRSKCYNAIYEMAANTAVVFVSHNMPMIKRLCSQVIVMNHGKVQFHGDNVSKGIEEYLGIFDSEKNRIMELGESRITNITLSAKKTEDHYEIIFSDDFTIDFDASIEQRFKKLEVNVTFISQAVEAVAQCNSKNNNVEILNLQSKIHCSITIPNFNLNPGTYFVSLSIVDAVTNTILSWHHASIRLKVIGNFFGGAPTQFIGEWNIAESQKFIDNEGGCMNHGC